MIFLAWKGTQNFPNYWVIGKGKFESEKNSCCCIWEMVTKDMVSCHVDEIFTSVVRSAFALSWKAPAAGSKQFVCLLLQHISKPWEDYLKNMACVRAQPHLQSCADTEEQEMRANSTLDHVTASSIPSSFHLALIKPPSFSAYSRTLSQASGSAEVSIYCLGILLQ